MEKNTHKGIFEAMAYYGDMQFPVRAEVEYNDKEAEDIEKVKAEHPDMEEDAPTLYDLTPSLGMSLRQAFLEQCPEDMQMNAEEVDFDYIILP